MNTTSTPILVVGPQTHTSDTLLALCQATGHDAWHYTSLPERTPFWNHSPSVFITTSIAEKVTHKRGGIALIDDKDLDEIDLYRKAMESGAEEVFSLEKSIDDIVDFLNRHQETQECGELYIVEGTSGGIGCTSLTLAMAEEARQQGKNCIMIDTHRLHAGLSHFIDGALEGSNKNTGHDWADFANVDGRLSPHHLHDTLRTIKGIPCLTWHQDHSRSTDIELNVIISVIEAAQRSYDCVIVDWAAEQFKAFPLTAHHVTLMRANRCEAEIAHALSSSYDKHKIVLCGKIPAGVDRKLIEKATQAPLSFHLKHQKQLQRLETAEAAEIIKKITKSDYPALARICLEIPNSVKPAKMKVRVKETKRKQKNHHD